MQSLVGEAVGRGLVAQETPNHLIESGTTYGTVSLDGVPALLVRLPCVQLEIDDARKPFATPCAPPAPGVARRVRAGLAKGAGRRLRTPLRGVRRVFGRHGAGSGGQRKPI